jgi:DNA-binding transcriptional LysR family regulator
VHVDEPSPIWAVTPSGRNRVPRVRAFLDFLVERLGSAPWRVEA